MNNKITEGMEVLIFRYIPEWDIIKIMNIILLVLF